MSASSYPLPLSAIPSTVTANNIFAGPVSGIPAAAAFRAAVAEDIATGVATSGYAPLAAGVGVKPAWGPVSAIVIGSTTGKDRNRPAASAGNFYTATDTGIFYSSTGSLWTIPGFGSDKVTLGSLAGGFSDTTYLNSPASATSGPTFALNTSICFGFYVISLPGVGGGIIAGTGAGASVTSGWIVGNSTVNSNKLRMLLAGVNASGNIEINATLTTGFHVLAANYNGTSIRFSLDGATVVASAALSGTYTVPAAGATTVVGRFFGNTGFSCPWMEFGFMQAYGSLLSDADLQALGGALTTYQPGAITADPTYNFQSRWMNLYVAASGVVGFAAYGTAANDLGTAGNKAAYLSPQGIGISKTNR